MSESKRAIIVGAGLSGLVTAKELIEVGIDNVIILEQEQELGGVWRKYCWNTTTMTSSKWLSEFGSYPMPDFYPDFLTPEQMLEYLSSFTKTFNLEEHIHCGITVEAVRDNGNGKYNVHTDNEIYQDYDIVVLCTGIHGQPDLPELPGLKTFEGTILHGSQYKTPESFKDKRVLCIGLGESGVGISSEISSVAANTIVSASALTLAPRVYPHTNIPFDQMQFWPIGEYMKDYQEVLNLGMSWYYKLPEFLRPAYTRFHLWLKLFPKEWLPKAVIPEHWHAKYWPKPNKFVSGNLTQPTTPSDDILYLVHSQQIEAKGRTVGFDAKKAYFEDGSSAEIDTVVINAGYKPSVLAIELPQKWEYREQELYKSSFHPDFPNVAFVGLIRPTVGSLPAMAEMQARFVAQVFSNNLELPNPQELKRIIAKESNKHAHECPAMQARTPHVYFFDKWMEEMAELIGCRPKIGDHLRSLKQLQSYWLGSPMPLRFRLRGPGAVKNGYERYADRVDKVYSSGFGAHVRKIVLLSFLYPHILTLLFIATLILGFHLSPVICLGAGAVFWLLYMKVDLFRFLLSFPNLLRINAMIRKTLIEYTDSPQFSSSSKFKMLNYKSPEVLQVDTDVDQTEVVNKQTAPQL